VATPYTEVDLDSVVRGLVNAAMSYNRRNLGMVGLKAFEVGFMTPADFRLQLYRTFGIVVSGSRW